MSIRRRPFSTKEVEEFLVNVPQLMELLQSQAKALNVGMGMVCGGRPVRITGLWPVSFSPFCNLVRRSQKGEEACQGSDAKHCRLSKKRRQRHNATDYSEFWCHMGLVDLPAPIYVRGRYLADLFMGQMRNQAMTARCKSFLKKRHRELGLAARRVPLSTFIREYKRLRYRTLAEIREIDRVLRALADAIGTMAEYAHSLRSINKLSSELSPLVDMKSGLEIVYRTVAENLGFDSGGVWLAFRQDPSRMGAGFAKALRPLVLNWAGESEDQKLLDSLEIKVGKGMAGKIAYEKMPLFLTGQAKIREMPPAHPRYRKRRELKSFAGIPIVSQGSLLGVIELGSRRQHRFSSTDKELLQTVAIVAANFIRRTKERGLLAGMHSQRARKRLFSYLESELPLLFGCLAATVFVPRHRKGKTSLVPVFPKFIIKGLGDGSRSRPWSSEYGVDIGEGLTGWAGKYKVCIRVRNCADQDEIRQLYDSGALRGVSGQPKQPPQWTGKTRARAEKDFPGKDHSVIICPCVNKSKELLAVLRMCVPEGGPFSEDDEAFVKDVCDQLAICLDKLALRKKEVERSGRAHMAHLVGHCLHEFNRSIHRARGSVAQIQKAADAVGAIPPYTVTDALRAVDDLQQKLGVLVNAARNGKSAISARIQTTEIPELLNEIVEGQRAQCRSMEMDVDFEIRPREGNCRLNTDREEMRDCIDGVLYNSVEAIQATGSKSGRIVTTWDRVDQGKSLRLQFEDTGPGFKEDVLRLVNQGELIPRSKCRGLGISLQGCKAFVEDYLGGMFRAGNRRKGGALVFWEFPIGKRRR